MKHLEAVIFDWAGTTVDHGSLAPVKAVSRLFAAHAIALSDADVRRDMGIFKKDHIRRILAMPHVASQWGERNGRAPDEGDVESLFTDFQPLQMDVLGEYSQVIEGVADVAERLARRGLKIGSTTGYTRAMLNLLKASAAEQGYTPDLSLCPDDAPGGRPHPWMCLHIALDFRLTSTAAAVKVGDTPSDIQEGLNAGMWTVAVAATGNEMGLSAAELAALPPEERERRLEHARRCLEAAGAHYVIDAAAHLEPVLEQIEKRLRAGERP